jgi:hypothetical protein
MPRPLSPSWWAAVALLALALCVVFRDLAISRTVRFDAAVENAGPRWEVGWRDSRGRRDGHWYDLGEKLHAVNAPSHSTSAPLPMRRRLANYALSEIRLAWYDSPAAIVRIQSATVVTRVLGRPLAPEGLVVLDAPGADVERDREGWVVRCTAPAGQVRFNAPPVPSAAWVSMGLVMAAVAGLLMCLPASLAWLGRALEAIVPLPADRPGGRWLGPIMWAVVLAVPLWLLLGTPMLVTSDSTAYIWLAERVIASGGFSELDGWRLPGYAMLLLPLIARVHDYVAGMGVIHAAMAVASSLLVFDLLRARIPLLWARIITIALALDMPVQVWQRVMLAEHTGGFLTLLAVWLVLKAAQGGPGSSNARRWCWAALAGFALAGACYTRANLQVFAAALPLVLWWAGDLGSRARARSGLAAAIVCAVVTASALLPLVLRNARVFGQATLAVGTDWNRFLWLWDYGAIDWNQSGAMTFEQFRDLRDRCVAREIDAWGVTDWLQENAVPPLDAPAAALHPWTQRDLRCAAVWRESAARVPEPFPGLMVRSTLAHLGLKAFLPQRARDEPLNLVNPILGRAATVDGTNWLYDIHRFSGSVRPVLDRSVRPWPDRPGWSARAWGVLHDAFGWVHHALGLLMLAGVLRLWARGERFMAGVGLVLVLHALALSVHVFATSPRYSEPLAALLAVVAAWAWLGRREGP